MFWKELSKLLVALDAKAVQLSLLVPLLAAALMVLAIARMARWRLPLVRLGYASALACALGLVVYACHYPAFVGVYDHLEPTVIEIVRRTAAGEPAYHALDAASRYSMLYGPNAYWVPAIATRAAGGSLTAVKMLSAGFVLASFALTMLALRRLGARGPAFAAGVIYFCGAALLFREKLIWVRGDPQLLFWAAVGMWGATLRAPVAAWGVIGFALGACMNTKAHGALYLVPALALVLPRASGRSWLALAVVAGGTLALPFWASPAFGLANYLAWLRVASGHGLSATAALEVGMMGAALALPLSFVWWRWAAGQTDDEHRAWWRRYWPSGLLCLGAAGLLFVAASKHGGGEWHLMPLVPAGAVLLALALRGSEEKNEATPSPVGMWAVGSMALTAFAVLNCAIAVARVPGRMTGSWYLTRPVHDDVRKFIATHARETVAMGCGDDATYQKTFARTELPGVGPFVVDTGALMDMQQGGVTIPRATLDELQRGVVQHWLLPKGDRPFTMRSWYEGQDIFGPEFRRIFAQHYRKTDTTEFFDVWTFQPK